MRPASTLPGLQTSSRYSDEKSTDGALLQLQLWVMYNKRKQAKHWHVKQDQHHTQKGKTMTELLSSKMRADKAKENFDVLWGITMKNEEEDAFASKFMEHFEKMTCNQVDDLRIILETLYGCFTAACQERSKKLLISRLVDPDGTNKEHEMCNAERRMYETMDELDREFFQ